MTHISPSMKTAWLITSAILGLLTASAHAQAPQAQAPITTLVYFVRHGEDMPEQVAADPTYSVTFNNCNAEGTCCVEALNPLGQVRASALADWLETKGITRTLTHVVASHKLRTRQTVAKIAKLAGLGGDLDGNGTLDGTDVDQAPGDGVINVPSTPAECDAGWTSSSSVTQPQTAYIKTLPLGSRAVVCSHSPVLYPLMQALGIDTSDPERFPKDSRGRVVGFNNLWAIELKPVAGSSTLTYEARLLSHVRLDIDLGVSLITRDYGVGQGQGSQDDE